jgi:hypothetical protein
MSPQKFFKTYIHLQKFKNTIIVSGPSGRLPADQNKLPKISKPINFIIEIPTKGKHACIHVPSAFYIVDSGCD